MDANKSKVWWERYLERFIKPKTDESILGLKSVFPIQPPLPTAEAIEVLKKMADAMEEPCSLGDLPIGSKVKIDGCWWVVKDQQENKTFLEQVGFCNSYEDYLYSIRFNDKPLKQFVDEDILGKERKKDE